MSHAVYQITQKGNMSCTIDSLEKSPNGTASTASNAPAIELATAGIESRLAGLEVVQAAIMEKLGYLTKLV